MCEYSCCSPYKKHLEILLTMNYAFNFIFFKAFSYFNRSPCMFGQRKEIWRVFLWQFMHLKLRRQTPDWLPISCHRQPRETSSNDNSSYLRLKYIGIRCLILWKQQALFPWFCGWLDSFGCLIFRCLKWGMVISTYISVPNLGLLIHWK